MRREKWVLRPYRPDAIAAKPSSLSTDLISMLIYVISFNEALPHLNYRDSLRKRCYFYANRFNHVKNNHFENESKKSRVDGWKKLIFMEMCVWSRPERVWFDWSASPVKIYFAFWLCIRSGIDLMTIGQPAAAASVEYRVRISFQRCPACAVLEPFSD